MKYKTNEIIEFLRARKDFFEKEFTVKKIGIFGSYARDDVHAGSDIDLVVELEKPDLFYMIGVKQTVEEALGNKVDIVRLRKKMNKVLKRRIEQDVIYV
jgi:predicted nucleotidyltransferase